jgi:CubicO group peptidase (beta-lactamase class C family)
MNTMVRETANRVGILIGTGLMLLATTSHAADYAGWLRSTYRVDGPGAAVIVMRDGDVLFRGASGMADLELGVQLQPDHVFRLGSLTKQFTAAAILLLQEQEKLNIEDDITVYLPDFPTQGQTIKIKHLLSHTSGVFNLTDDPSYWSENRHFFKVNTEELIDTFKDVPLVFEPGQDTQYSNSGYILLGAIIEAITGEPYYTFIENEIFKRLGMNNSHNGGPQIIPKRVEGYYSIDDGYMNAPYVDITRPHAAGSLLSSVNDLAIWSNALFGGELLPANVVREMTTIHVLESGKPSSFGYGFFIGNIFGHRQVSHYGGIHGFNTFAIWLPDIRVYVAVLANITGHEIGPQFLGTRLALAAAGIDDPHDTVFDLQDKNLTDYAGEYRINEESSRKVFLDAGMLFTVDTGDSPYKLKPFATDSFIYPNYYEYLVFKRNDAGVVTHMEIHYGGSAKGESAVRIGD